MTVYEIINGSASQFYSLACFCCSNKNKKRAFSEKLSTGSVDTSLAICGLFYTYQLGCVV